MLLLVLGGIRHRVEPWLRTLSQDPPPEVLAALPEIDTEKFGRVDVNRAGPEELESLPGIGPRLAARIVEDRRLRGPFMSLNDLDRVTGIGPHLLGRIRDAATIGPPDAAPIGRSGDRDSLATGGRGR